ncbi:MAG: hypothetical protein R6U98_21975 [Pirellulaceae bacterium]
MILERAPAHVLRYSWPTGCTRIQLDHPVIVQNYASPFCLGATASWLIILQAVGCFRVESCPTQAVLPLVGLPAEQVIRDRDTWH